MRNQHCMQVNDKTRRNLAWWRVDLGSTYVVISINITNRDVNQGKLKRCYWLFEIVLCLCMQKRVVGWWGWGVVGWGVVGGVGCVVWWWGVVGCWDWWGLWWWWWWGGVVFGVGDGGGPGFANDCPCWVWCRRLTTCLQYDGPPFGNPIWNDCGFVSLA